MELPRRLRLRGWLLGFQRLQELSASRGFKNPQRAALQMIHYADQDHLSRQEIRELARAWSCLPIARATARILAQTLAKSYRAELESRLADGRGTTVWRSLPVKFVAGGSDRLYPPEQAQRLHAKLPGSELLIADGSSNAAHVERPEWIAEIIARAAGA
jgi:pimeloyl-ACP methyl ester carboxylesterase